jgi:hypothetical protein
MVDWPPMPSDEEIMAAHAEKWREAMFWQESYERLRHEYPNLWVAVKDGEVIDTDTHQWPLLQRLRAAGLEWPQVWTSFVPREPMSLML